MKITYDPSVDAAYISLLIGSEWSPFGKTYCCNQDEVGGEINLDFDFEGRLIGIEILQASKKLPAPLMANLRV